MPITKSATKAMNRSEKLAKRNKDFKIRMKMAMKKFIKTAQKDPSTLNAVELSNLQKAIDKCAKVGIIKKKNASRKKARMAKMFHTTTTK